jgi:hypothetical protein
VNWNWEKFRGKKGARNRFTIIIIIICGESRNFHGRLVVKQTPSANSQKTLHELKNIETVNSAMKLKKLA